jgi:hypothetical protein
MRVADILERTPEEHLDDDTLLLCLWAQAQERSKSTTVGDRLKLMKLAFLPTYHLFRERTKALNLKFFRYKHGPYSKEVADAWDDLEAADLMVEEELFTVTASGRKLAADFYREVLALPDNEAVRAAFYEVVIRYATVDTTRLVAEVYQMPCYTIKHPDVARPISKIPRGEDLTDRLRADVTNQALYVPDEWRSTLELVFHPEAHKNLRRGIQDSRSGRVLTAESMWEGV